MSDRVVVIGNPDSVFVQTPVRYWRSLGIDAVVLTAQWAGSATVGGDVPVVTAEALVPSGMRRIADGLVPFLNLANTVANQDRARVASALETWGPSVEPPSIAPPLWRAPLIAAASDSLDPACVLGHEAFAYGLATSLCAAPRRALFAWGADVLQYARMSDMADGLVRQSLSGVDYVLTTSRSMEDALHTRFDIPRERIAVISYGVDRQQFCPAIGVRAERIRGTYGLAPNARVLMNLRRFMSHWGSTIAWPAMMAAAERRADVHLVLLAGEIPEADITCALEQAHARGLGGRVTAMRGTVPLDTVADLMSIADVGLSLVDATEPLSWSVLQAVASGAAVVVRDQATYRDECARGLSVRLAPGLDADQLTDTIVELLDDVGLRARMRVANDCFIREYHDQHAHLVRLLHIVAGRDTAQRLLRAGRLQSAAAGVRVV